MKVYERFMNYVLWDTTSNEDASVDGTVVPSTPGQMDFAKYLLEELKSMGIEDVNLDEKGYIYGSLPTSQGLSHVPTIGFLAHLDTSESCLSPTKAPRIIKNYDGGSITLENGLTMGGASDSGLAACAGEDLIVTDGRTLLGGDDKAGIAEIVSALSYLMEHQEIRHGKIAFSFTPDEEIGTSQDNFDVAAFGADFAYTVDGGFFGEIEYENFYAASAKVEVNGVTTHPGSAKNVMKNASIIAMEFNHLLPPWERPEHTEGYEGFFHLENVTGNCTHSTLNYLIREHDQEKFGQRKALMEQAASIVNGRYGEGTLQLDISDSYRNMAEKVRPHMHLIDYAHEEILKLGSEPVTRPIRGGTDGSELSYKGVPCPNLGTGSFHHHSVMEVASINQMEKCTELIVRLAQRYGEWNRE